MRNTHIPLDIGYFTADGILRDLSTLSPRRDIRRSIRSNLLFALEVNQGWYEKHGVKPGDKLIKQLYRLTSFLELNRERPRLVQPLKLIIYFHHIAIQLLDQWIIA